jgi:hypothetical protein
MVQCLICVIVIIIIVVVVGEGHVVRMGERRVLVGKPEGKRPLGRPRRKWEDIIKMNLQEVGCGGIEWIDLTQDRDSGGGGALVNVVMNLRVP